MKLNENTVIFGKNVALVPYKKHHVAKYHTWMKQKELQNLTASEPLSLDEEYKMQISWHKDDQKLTFIILDKHLWQQSCKAMQSSHRQTVADDCLNFITTQTETVLNETNCMVGDVNLFANNNSWSCPVEISVMVAETSYRRKGYGTEAVLLMMAYAIEQLQIQTFVAKIGLDNTPSIKMFTDKLNFIEIDKSKVFNEVTLEFNVAHNFSLLNNDYNVLNYDCLTQGL